MLWPLGGLSFMYQKTTKLRLSRCVLLLRYIYHDNSYTDKIIRPYPSPFLVSSPVAFKFLNVLVLNIAEKLLAGRYAQINQSIIYWLDDGVGRQI